MNYSQEEKIKLADSIVGLFAGSNKQLDTAVLKVWIKYIENAPMFFEAADWIEAMGHVAYSAESFPTLGKIYSSIKAKRGVDDSCLAEKAWESVLRHLASKGAAFPFEGPQHIKNSIMAAGGLSVIAMSDEKNIDFRKKSFIQFYINKSSNDSHVQLADSKAFVGIDFGNGSAERLTDGK